MNTKNKPQLELPYPPIVAGPSPSYSDTTMSLVAQPRAGVSVTLTKSAFPASNGDPAGVWMDIEELRKLHPRASWLLDGAGIYDE